MGEDELDIGNITLSGSYDDWIKDYISNINIDEWAYTAEPQLQSNDISLTAGGEEMLRVAPDGFYVRGERVPAGKKESRAVYNAFKQWMTAAILSGEINN